jgi:hypothetical protein
MYTLLYGVNCTFNNFLLLLSVYFIVHDKEKNKQVQIIHTIICTYTVLILCITLYSSSMRIKSAEVARIT